ncbi:MAG: prepilin-type N-terminal cleavage/methylation domain-containing protein [bacterium]|nr:prepilin-type N-terminal cleavage/methylation domain-containing protein [bacterium]
MLSFAKSKKGFTLVEIMIVVAIIGILAAIAIPNFIKSRKMSRAKACVSNLKQIDGAVQQWALETKKTGGETVTTAVLMSDISPYLRGAWSTCPSNDSVYPRITFAVSSQPECPNYVLTSDEFSLHILP